MYYAYRSRSKREVILAPRVGSTPPAHARLRAGHGLTVLLLRLHILVIYPLLCIGMDSGGCFVERICLELSTSC